MAGKEPAEPGLAEELVDWQDTSEALVQATMAMNLTQLVMAQFSEVWRS